MTTPVRPDTDQILSTLILIEDHARGARGACAAAVRLANLPDDPKIVAPSASESLSMANGHPLSVSQTNGSQRDQQLGQMNAAAGQHLGQVFGLVEHLHKLVTSQGDQPNAGVAG